MRTLTLVVASLALLTTSCREPAPKLRLLLPSDDARGDMFRSAEIIVVGKVQSLNFVGPVVQSYRLIKVEVTVENVLQGAVSTAQPLIFYFYSVYLLGSSGDMNRLRDDRRYVFFLNRENGVLRAVWDVMRSNIIVSSGKHKALPLSDKEPLSERIAVMLFTPGDDMNTIQFSDGLLRATGYTFVPIGTWRTAKLLTSLLQSSERAVRVGACEELTLDFLQNSCWGNLDVAYGADLRYHYGVITPQVSRSAHRNHLMETQDPEQWWTELGYTRNADRLGALKLLTIDDDQRIRQRFCVYLKKKFPAEVMDSGCTHISP